MIHWHNLMVILVSPEVLLTDNSSTGCIVES